MRVIGVDAGSMATGYGIVEYDKNNWKLLGYGTIRNSSKTPFPERLDKISKSLRKTIRELKPETLTIEGGYVFENPSTALKLGQVRGAILLIAAEEGLPVREYSPATIKQAVTGYGSADKEQVQKMVCYMLNMKSAIKSKDASDAIATAICHLLLSRKNAMERK